MQVRPHGATVEEPTVASVVEALTYHRSVAGITRTDEPDGVRAVLPLRASTGGSAGSFLVIADNQRRYWCKPVNNLQSSRVPVTEQIVGRLGALLGAAVCEPALIRLDGLAGYEFRPGHFVEPGWAHGSAAVDTVLETRALDDRAADDNRCRHAGFFVLHDWLAGSDAQWLYDTAADNMYFSHDHGFYLTGPDWTAGSLASGVAEDFSLAGDATGLDPTEVGRLAEVLEALSKEDIDAEVSKLPASWPVTDEELAAVADFAEQRRGPVVARFRTLVP